MMEQQEAAAEATVHEPQTAHCEPISQLVFRARALIKSGDDKLVSAGVVLAELKERVTDRSTDEGKEWHWAWRRFVEQNDLGVTRKDGPISVNYANRLIGYAGSPEKVEERRKTEGDRIRKKREGANVGTIPDDGVCNWGCRDGGKPVEARRSPPPVTAEELALPPPEADRMASLQAAWAAASQELRADFLKDVTTRVDNPLFDGAVPRIVALAGQLNATSSPVDTFLGRDTEGRRARAKEILQDIADLYKTSISELIEYATKRSEYLDPLREETKRREVYSQLRGRYIGHHILEYALARLCAMEQVSVENCVKNFKHQIEQDALFQEIVLSSEHPESRPKRKTTRTKKGQVG